MIPDLKYNANVVLIVSGGATMRQLRYWDQTGLVSPSIQATGGRPGVPRIYSRDDILRLRAVTLALESGGPGMRGRSLQNISTKGFADELLAVRIVDQDTPRITLGRFRSDEVLDELRMREVRALDRLYARRKAAA